MIPKFEFGEKRLMFNVSIGKAAYHRITLYYMYIFLDISSFDTIT